MKAMRLFASSAFLLILSLFTLPVFAQSSPYTPFYPEAVSPGACLIYNYYGETDSINKYCMPPSQIIWKSDIAYVVNAQLAQYETTYFSDYYQSGDALVYDFLTQYTEYCNLGPCSSVWVKSDPPPWSYLHQMFTFYPNSSQNYGSSNGWVEQIPICAPGWVSQYMWDSTHTNLMYTCVRNPDVAWLHVPHSSDVTNSEGECTSCNPVNIATSTKQDDVTDFQNQSPFPIIWSRHWNGVLAQWHFNYDRKIILPSSIGGRGANMASASVVISRGDGQTFAYTGTNNNGTWTWVPNLDSAKHNAMMLITLTSNTDLSSFTLVNHHDEIETYNGKGQLVSLNNAKNLPLTFTYDTQGRLSEIQDASNRHLTITYPDDDPPPVSPYLTAVPSSDRVQTYPDTVSDGVHTIGYVFVPNPQNANGAVILQQVLKADNTTLTYQYDALNNFTGITDENGDAYATYTYQANSNMVIQTYHGDHHETTGFGGSIVLPTGQSIPSTANEEGKLSFQSAPCPVCAGLQKNSVVYDSTSNPTQLTDFDGNVETRVYDQTRGVPTSIVQGTNGANPRTITYQWDSRFLKPDQMTYPVSTPYGDGTLTQTNTYDNQGNLTAWQKAVTGPGGFSNTISGSATYNTFGEPLTVTDPNHNVTTYTYDTQGNLTSKTNAQNQTVTYGGYDVAGNPGWTQDANGLMVKYTYNALQHITQIQTGCDGTSPPAAGNGPCHWETIGISYTPFEAVDTITHPSGRALKYHYDTAHRVTQIDELDSNGALLGSKVVTQTEASQISNLTFKDAQGNTLQSKSYTYDNLNRMTAFVDAYNKTFGKTYDNQSNVVSDVDPLSHGSTYTYDALNRLTQKTLNDSTTETYQYGANNEVTLMANPNNQGTGYVYDGFGNVVTVNSPDNPQWYTYDSDFNVLTAQNGAGYTLTSTYDALNRKLTQTTDNGQYPDAITWTYDTCTNGVGRVCSISNGSGTVTFQYDRWGRVVQKQTTVAGMASGVSLTLSYTYDNAGQLTGITYPSGNTLTQTWLNGNVMIEQWGSNPILSNITYDPWHRITGWTWGSGRNVNYTYDLAGRVSQIQYGSGVRAFTYDDAWKLGGVNQTNPTLSLSYGYDGRNRLTTSNNWGTYTYDNNSNRLSWLGGPTPTSYTYGRGVIGDILQSINGVQTQRSWSGNIQGYPDGRVFTYDGWDRMKTSTTGGITTTYGVNGLGERVSKVQGTQSIFFIYDHLGQVMGRYDANGNAIEEFVYLNGKPVADVRGTNTYYVETDQISTPVRVLDSSNNVVWSWEDHEPFGASDPVETMVNGHPFYFNLRFPGQYFDVESGLVQNGYRDYDPQTGRYLEIDPMGLSAGMNPYGYAGAGPLGNVDLNGLHLIPVWDDNYPDSYAAYNNAIEWLSQSPSAKALIDALDNNDNNFYIYIHHCNGKNGVKNQEGWSANGRNLAVDWTENVGLDIDGKIQSPAIGLIHELYHLGDHAPSSITAETVDFLFAFPDSWNNKISNFTNDVIKEIPGGTEARAVNFENIVANEIDPSMPMRTSHREGTPTLTNMQIYNGGFPR